jgi:PST family polysaccharide transporter
MMKSRKHKDANTKTLWENVLSLSVLQGFVYLFPVVILGYLSEVIGIDNLGAIVFAQATVNYFLSFVDYGFKLYGTREIATNKNDPEKLSKVFTTIMAIKVLLLLTSVAVIGLLVLTVPEIRDKGLLIFFTLGLLLGDVLIPVWFFQGMEKMKYMTVLNIITQTIFFVLVLTVVQEESHFLYVPLLQSAGYLVAGILCLALVFRNFPVRLVPIGLQDIKYYIKSGFSVFMTDFLPNLYNNSTEFLLGFFGSDAAVGFYGVAKRVVDAVNQVIYVISRAFYPLLNRDYNYFPRFKQIILGSGMGLSVLVLLFSDHLLALMPSDKLAGAMPLLKILGLSPFFMAVMLCFGTNYLLVKRMDRLYMQITLAVSVLGLIMALAIIPWFLQNGAAFTLVFARGLLALLGFIAYWYHSKSRPTKLRISDEGAVQL